VIFAFSPAAHGQDDYDDPFYGLKPTISYQLPNFRYTALLGIYKYKSCSSYSNDVGVTYPVNTGSRIFDDFLVGYAKNKFFEEAQVDFECFEPTTYEKKSEHRTTFTAEIVGENYLSIMFTTHGYNIGAAGGNAESASFIFDLKNQKFIELSDIFVNPKQSVPLLWPLVVNGWCQLDMGDIPFEYDLPMEQRTCGQSIPPTPASFLADYVPFQTLGTVILDRSGMVIRLEYPFARGLGPQKITISREALIRLGAKPEIWQ
jgi:hypothetical protein